jgi:hypothetical protein
MSIIDEPADERTKAEILESLREAMSYGVIHKTPAPRTRKPGEYFRCINGHVWDNEADAAKCCTGVWRPVMLSGGQVLMADFGAIRPLGDEFEEMAKKGNRHSLGDELFGGVK